VQRALAVSPDATQEFFQGVQVIGDRPCLADLTAAPPFGHGGGDRFFVDIKPDVEFSFGYMVCLFVRVSLVDSERSFAQHGVVLADSPSRAARVL